MHVHWRDSTVRNRRVWCDYFAAQELVHVMLHVQHIILDHKAQRDRRTIPDKTQRFQSAIWNAVHQRQKERITLEPDIDDGFPWQIAVTVQPHPIVLRIPRSPKFSVERRANESHVIIGR